jgi:hypothetical protein
MKPFILRDIANMCLDTVNKRDRLIVLISTERDNSTILEKDIE